MYGRKASELVKEFASIEPGQLSTFNVSNIVLRFMWSIICAFLTGLVYTMVLIPVHCSNQIAVFLFQVYSMIRFTEHFGERNN